MMFPSGMPRGGAKVALAPEILFPPTNSGQVLDYDKADIWSFGCIVAIMFTTGIESPMDYSTYQLRDDAFTSSALTPYIDEPGSSPTSSMLANLIGSMLLQDVRLRSTCYDVHKTVMGWLPTTHDHQHYIPRPSQPLPIATAFPVPPQVVPVATETKDKPVVARQQGFQSSRAMLRIPSTFVIISIIVLLISLVSRWSTFANIYTLVTTNKAKATILTPTPGPAQLVPLGLPPLLASDIPFSPDDDDDDEGPVRVVVFGSEGV
jgi:serine/threonine protein kinase